MKTNEINDFPPRFLSGSDCGIEIPLALLQTGLLPPAPSLNEFTKSTCMVSFSEYTNGLKSTIVCIHDEKNCANVK